MYLSHTFCTLPRDHVSSPCRCLSSVHKKTWSSRSHKKLFILLSPHPQIIPLIAFLFPESDVALQRSNSKVCAPPHLTRCFPKYESRFCTKLLQINNGVWYYSELCDCMYSPVFSVSPYSTRLFLPPMNCLFSAATQNWIGRTNELPSSAVIGTSSVTKCCLRQILSHFVDVLGSVFCLLLFFFSLFSALLLIAVPMNLISSSVFF